MSGDPSVHGDAYRELFERSADAILFIEGDRFIDCNDAAVRMLRCANRAQVLETHPSELSPPLQPDGRSSFEKANEMIAIAFERGSHRFEWEHRRADGEVFPVEVLLTAVSEPERRVLHVVWRDITERKLLEDKLRQAQKMEAIGKLTGGIAHDFNNLLVAVLGNADLLTELLEERPEARELACEIRDAGHRAAALVRQLLAFGRKQQLLPVVLDLNVFAEEMRGFLRRVIGEDVTLELLVDAGPVPIEVDRTQLEQVVLNIAANARDAMADGGRLRLEVARCVIEVASDLAEELATGEYALLRFTDTGVGMDAGTVERAFDPFFTTKEVGKGTGLGLATVYGVVKQSGGAARIDSKPGGGTTVDVFLPITAKPLEEPPTSTRTRERTPGDEVVLVVEDDRRVSRMVVRTLEDRGYDVLAAANGREGLACYLENADRVDLVVTDVIMPEMSGPQLVEELRSAGHTPAVLFMSGYTGEGLRDLLEDGEEVDVLAKPFDPQLLTRRVRAALDARTHTD